MLEQLLEERRQQILTMLAQQGKVTSVQLSQQLMVSEDTIRRDLKALANAGLLKKVHGGALPIPVSSRPFPLRQEADIEAKRALAQTILPQLAEYKTIFLDTGTTNLTLAQAIPQQIDATIITPSPLIAITLAEHPHLTVIQLGGTIQPHTSGVVGNSVIQQIERIYADVCIIGVCSVDAEFGMSTTHLDDAEVKRAMITQSAETILLCLAEKIGTRSSFQIAPTAKINKLITESSAEQAQLMPFIEQGTLIIQE